MDALVPPGVDTVTMTYKDKTVVLKGKNMDMRTTFKTANARGLKFAAGYDTKEETFVVKLTITVINPAGSQVAELAELARSGDLDLELTANQLPLPLSAR